MTGSGKRYKGGRRFTLEWGADTDFDGLEVVMRSISFGGLLDMAEMADRISLAEAGSAMAAGGLAALRTFCDRLALSMVWWNVDDDDGELVPLTAEGLLSQDADMVMEIFTRYFGHVTRASPPLPQPSPTTPSQAETAIPMVPLHRAS